MVNQFPNIVQDRTFGNLQILMVGINSLNFKQMVMISFPSLQRDLELP